MYAGVLPDIERGKMKAEGPHFSQQGIEDRVSQTRAAIGCKAGPKQLQVVGEFLRGGVGAGIARFAAAVTKSGQNETQEAAIDLGLRNASGGRGLVGDAAVIVAQSRSQFG